MKLLKVVHPRHGKTVINDIRLSTAELVTGTSSSLVYVELAYNFCTIPRVTKSKLTTAAGIHIRRLNGMNEKHETLQNTDK